MSLASGLLTGIIRVYQRLVSPFLPPACRFHPTCSEYACQAIESKGIITGVYLTVKRVFRCHPWNEGGFDPVPK